MGVRAARPEDVPHVARLWTALCREELSKGAPIALDESSSRSWMASFERHLQRFAFLWVAEHDRKIVGFLLARLKSRPPYLGGALIGELSSIYVEPSSRATGLGKLLVRTAIAELRARAAQSIEVEAYEGNAAARAFWTAMHFEGQARTYRARKLRDDDLD